MPEEKTLKETSREYAELKQNIATFQETLSIQINSVNKAMEEVVMPFKTTIEEIKATHAPTLKIMADKLSALETAIKKDLKEQVVLDDGTKVNCQVNRKLEIVKGKDYAFFKLLGEQVKGSQENVKFNFAQCGIVKLVDAKALKLDPDIAEIKESKSVTVKYPKKK